MSTGLFMLGLFLIWGIAGYRATRRLRAMGAGSWAGSWAAMVGMLFAITYGFSQLFWALPHSWSRGTRSRRISWQWLDRSARLHDRQRLRSRCESADHRPDRGPRLSAGLGVSLPWRSDRSGAGGTFCLTDPLRVLTSRAEPAAIREAVGRGLASLRSQAAAHSLPRAASR